MAPVHGAEILQLDFMSDNALKIIKKALGGEADAVLSDMAPKITGHANTDHIRIMGLAETAYDFAKEVLAPGGCFVSKVFQGGTEKVLLNDMKLSFGKVQHSKPPSSRAESAEMFVVAQNYRRDTKK
jgi:23S rRNA (uridine2552-2'-O)-methyltransferase